MTYAAVPLYRAFCSATGFSGTPLTDPARFEPSRLVPAYLNPSTGAQTRRIRVTFNADASDAIPWSFSPQQKEVNVLPGETALAFYTAKNRSKQDIVGIATYNVTPDKVSGPRDLGRYSVRALRLTLTHLFLPFHATLRSLLTLPKSSASASRSKSCWPVKK